MVRVKVRVRVRVRVRVSIRVQTKNQKGLGMDDTLVAMAILTSVLLSTFASTVVVVVGLRVKGQGLRVKG